MRHVFMSVMRGLKCMRKTCIPVRRTRPHRGLLWECMVYAHSQRTHMSQIARVLSVLPLKSYLLALQCSRARAGRRVARDSHATPASQLILETPRTDDQCRGPAQSAWKR